MRRRIGARRASIGAAQRATAKLHTAIVDRQREAKGWRIESEAIDDGLAGLGRVASRTGAVRFHGASDDLLAADVALARSHFAQAAAASAGASLRTGACELHHANGRRAARAASSCAGAAARPAADGGKGLTGRNANAAARVAAEQARTA
jgi:hypothetical protein